MSELISVFSEEWAIRALLASSMVGIMCGILGCFIVLRNMSLIGDALAHAILPGVVFAFMLVGYNVLGFFTGAVIAGLITSVAITWIQHNAKTKNDAAIGIVFTAMFSVGVIAISYISRNQGVHLDLKDFLFGNILGVSNEDLYLTLAITIYVMLSIIVFYRYLFATTFQPVLAQTMGISVQVVHYFLMLLLSFAVVASLRTVGVILVVAMLITPASTALLLSDRLKQVLFIAAGFGLLSAVSGLVIAIVVGTTPGPAMAVMATLFYLLAVLFSPKKGVVFRAIHKRKLTEKIRFEDTLKQALKLHEIGQLTFSTMLDRLGYKKTILQKQLSLLKSKRLIEQDGNSLVLQQGGKDEANKLVRAHRLWETYLVQQMGLTKEQIHDDAEKYEHLLSKELLDEVDMELGYPSIDPHGSPIPVLDKKPNFALSELNVSTIAKIASRQISDKISSRLWQMGLLPGFEITVLNVGEKFIKVSQNGDTIEIPVDFARQINVVQN